MLSGGDAAETFVRMMLSGTEIAVRLSGSAAKNALAFIVAAAKNHKRISGKLSLPKLLKAGADPRAFTMTAKHYSQFKKHAKRYRVLYSAIKEKRDRNADVTVMVAGSHLEQANQTFRKIQFVPEGEARSEKARETRPPKKDSRSGRDSSDTRSKSNMRNSSGERKNDRPSVEQKLKDFKAKAAQSVPTVQKTKLRGKGGKSL